MITKSRSKKKKIVKKKIVKKKLVGAVRLPKSLEAYMPLVHSIASIVSAKGLPPNIEYDDLVSDGAIGLMKASERFDPKRGVKFETYASYRIRGEILDGLRMYNPVPYRVQVMVRDMAKKGYKQIAKEKAEKEEKLLAKKELSEDEFQSALKRIKKIVSASALMYLLSIEGVQASRGEVAVKSGPTPEQELEFSELKQKLSHLVSNLPDQERKIVEMFYNQGINQKTIAAKLGLSRPKVNRVLGKAIMRLREKIK